MIVIVIMGILAAIAIPTWLGANEGSREDAASNQLAADLRLAHSTSTNRLENWRAEFTSGSSAYRMTGAVSGEVRNRTLCGDDGCGPRDPKVRFAGGGTATILFKPEGTAWQLNADGSLTDPPALRVSVDGDPYRLLTNSATSRVEIIAP